MVDSKLLSLWLNDHKTLQKWVELFALADKSTLGGVEVQMSNFVKFKGKQDKAKSYRTPAKKCVWDTLEEEEPWSYMGFDVDFNNEQKLAVIQTALLENQKEHKQFRSVNV